MVSLAQVRLSHVASATEPEDSDTASELPGGTQGDSAGDTNLDCKDRLRGTDSTQDASAATRKSPSEPISTLCSTMRRQIISRSV